MVIATSWRTHDRSEKKLPHRRIRYLKILAPVSHQSIICQWFTSSGSCKSTRCMLASLTCIHRTCTYNILRRYLHPSKPRHMNWSANVLTTVTSDTEPTVVVEFDSGKYIFNAGDNTNRAFNQSITNRKKTRGIFFSSVGTQRASGLSGEWHSWDRCPYH